LLRQGFAEWLQVLGYAATSVTNMPRHLAGVPALPGGPRKVQLAAASLLADATAFIAPADPDRHPHRPGFSAGHINKYIQALHLFSRYIRQSGKSSVGFTLELLEGTSATPTWLTRAEIRRLYAVTGEDVLGITGQGHAIGVLRLRVAFAGRGQPGMSDIGHDRRMLYVRRGKGYRERYVPIAEKSYQDIQVYIEQGRPDLLQRPCAVLFLDANKGRPIHKQSLYLRIKALVRKAGIITRPVGTHTLRHSIATHLLQSGMKLERIKEFLGHAASTARRSTPI
jgi:integrase/recombinase XerD